MTEARGVIPFERLPPGFAETLDRPPSEPAVPRPAATVVLLRDRDEGPEVVLLRRVRNAGFVPGAWVFPGGRVDAADAAPELLARWRGPAPSEVARRLDMDVDASPSAMAYLLAALRETFEETGLLLARDAAGLLEPERVDVADDDHQPDQGRHNRFHGTSSHTAAFC